MNSQAEIQVAAAVLQRGRRLLLALRQDPQGRPLGWEFPGGKRREGETFAACAVREIREELNVAMRPLGVLDDRTTALPDGRRIRMVAVAGEIEEGEPLALEHLRLAWVTRRELAGYNLLPPDIPLARALASHEIALPRTAPPRGLSLYLHIPFCLRKCGYCSFYSRPWRRERGQAYAAALAGRIRDLLPLMPYQELASVYLGGGTPSCLEAEEIGAILGAIRGAIRWPEGIECTMECNPATGFLPRFRALQAAGVNRISLGVQSLDDGELRTLGRLHTAEEARKTVLGLKAAGLDNLSLDLIYGVPGQSMESWLGSVRQVLALRPQHISFYALTLEKSVPLARGGAVLPEDGLVMDQYWQARELLEKGGYRMYEISNAALPGFEARHNMAYWDTDCHYLGLGPSAHSFCRLPFRPLESRFRFPADTGKFLAGQAPLLSRPLSRTRRLGERIYLGLRKTAGITLTQEEEALFAKEVAGLIENGLLEREERKPGAKSASQAAKIRLTRRGLELANQVMAEFV